MLGASTAAYAFGVMSRMFTSSRGEYFVISFFASLQDASTMFLSVLAHQDQIFHAIPCGAKLRD